MIKHTSLILIRHLTNHGKTRDKGGFLLAEITPTQLLLGQKIKTTTTTKLQVVIKVKTPCILVDEDGKYDNVVLGPDSYVL